MTFLLWLRAMLAKVPAAAWVVLFAGLALWAFGVYRYRSGVQDEHTRAQIELAEQLAKWERERESIEHAQRAELEDVRATLAREQNEGFAERDRVIADLRGGTVRLRERFTCPRVPAAATAAPGSDDTATRGLLGTDAEILVRLASDADRITRQLTACQDVIRTYVH